MQQELTPVISSVLNTQPALQFFPEDFLSVNDFVKGEHENYEWSGWNKTTASAFYSTKESWPNL